MTTTAAATSAPTGQVRTVSDLGAEHILRSIPGVGQLVFENAEKPEVPLGYCQCGCGAKTRPASKTDCASGRVKGQPVRYLRGHQRTGRQPGPLYLIEATTGCWIWQRYRNPKGYGVMRHNGPARFAHRVFYEQQIGPIPEGHELDHLCSNRACCNPAHLEPVTHAENVRRGRLARLTVDDVHAIRASDLGVREIAERYGITKDYVYDIKTGRSWRNV